MNIEYFGKAVLFCAFAPLLTATPAAADGWGAAGWNKDQAAK